MTTVTHIITGLAIGKLANTYTSVNFNKELVYGNSVMFSLLPDINMLWHKKVKTHHDDPTHYPTFWLVAGLVISIFNTFWGILLSICTLLHLVLDTFGWTIGIKWLAPLSKEEFSFTKLEKDKEDYSHKERIRYFLKNPSKFVFEVIVITTSLVYLFL